MTVGLVFLAIMVVIFSITGFVLVIGTLVAVTRGLSSKSWLTADGTIVASQAPEENKGENDDAAVYHPTIRYEYTLDGKPYSSETIDFVWWGHYFFWDAKRLVSKYPLHGHVKVYCNPRKAQQSVLEPGFEWPYAVGGLFFGLLFLAGGTALFCLVILPVLVS